MKVALADELIFYGSTGTKKKKKRQAFVCKVSQSSSYYRCYSGHRRGSLGVFDANTWAGLPDFKWCHQQYKTNYRVILVKPANDVQPGEFQSALVIRQQFADPVMQLGGMRLADCVSLGVTEEAVQAFDKRC